MDREPTDPTFENLEEPAMKPPEKQRRRPARRLAGKADGPAGKGEGVWDRIEKNRRRLDGLEFTVDGETIDRWVREERDR